MTLKFDDRKRYDVSIIGRVTIDFNPTDYYNTLDKNGNFNRYLGGSAGNIALGLARYEKKVNFISRTSNDQFGTFIKDYLLKEGIKVDQIQTDPKYKTGLTFTEMLNSQTSSILMYREKVADLEIAKNLINKEKIIDSKMLLISGVSLAKNPARKSCFLANKVATQAKIPLLFDLDYRPYTWKNKNTIFKTYWKVAKKSTILIGSEDEFDFLLKTEKNQLVDYEKLFKKIFHNYHAEIIVLKQGAKGSILYTKNQKMSIGIVKVTLLKGFGGGDAFASTFIKTILEKNNLQLALEKATCAAAMVVSSLSSSDSLPRQNELEIFYKNSKFETPLKIQEW